MILLSDFTSIEQLISFQYFIYTGVSNNVHHNNMKALWVVISHAIMNHHMYVNGLSSTASTVPWSRGVRGAWGWLFHFVFSRQRVVCYGKMGSFAYLTQWPFPLAGFFSATKFKCVILPCFSTLTKD